MGASRTACGSEEFNSCLRLPGRRAKALLTFTNLYEALLALTAMPNAWRCEGVEAVCDFAGLGGGNAGALDTAHVCIRVSGRDDLHRDRIAGEAVRENDPVGRAERTGEPARSRGEYQFARVFPGDRGDAADAAD